MDMLSSDFFALAASSGVRYLMEINFVFSLRSTFSIFKASFFWNFLMRDQT